MELFRCFVAGADDLASLMPLPLMSLRLFNNENDSRGSMLSFSSIDDEFVFGREARCHGGNVRIPCLVAGDGFKRRELSTSEM